MGSSSLITNLDGDIVQHIEYVPFGEVFIEERNSKWNTPYLFNAKELDEETGLYYYGARYYDPRISIFYGVDPLAEKTGTPYQYCYQNPVKFIDPTGMDGEVSEVKGSGTKKDPHVITIRAEYYYDKNEVIGEFLTGLNNSIAEYNKTESNRGNDKNGTYTVIRYNLKAIGYDNLEKANDARENSYFENSVGQVNVSRFGNIVRVTDGVPNPDPLGTNILGNDNGYTVHLFGNLIENSNKQSNIAVSKLAQYVFGHEIGHNLGAEHSNISPMGETMSTIPFMKNGCMGGLSCVERWDVNNTNKSLSKNLAPKLLERMNNSSVRQYLYLKKQ